MFVTRFENRCNHIRKSIISTTFDIASNFGHYGSKTYRVALFANDKMVTCSAYISPCYSIFLFVVYTSKPRYSYLSYATSKPPYLPICLTSTTLFGPQFVSQTAIYSNSIHLVASSFCRIQHHIRTT